MKEKAVIRAYKDSDKHLALDLLRLNTPTYFSPEEEKDFVHYLENEIEFYFVIELDNRIVGCGGFNFPDGRQHGRISWDILHPDYQGRALGSLLLTYRIEKLKEFEGLKTITVRTSQLAYRFYEKAGFKLVEKVDDYWAKGFDLYKMIYAE